MILSDLMKVFKFDEIKAQMKQVLEVYAQSRPEALTTKNFTLTRMFLLEIILIVIDICLIRTGLKESFSSALAYLVEEHFKPYVMNLQQV